MGRINFRLIAIIAVVGIVFLLAAGIVGLAYLQASSQSFGHFAPVGTPVNGKH